MHHQSVARPEDDLVVPFPLPRLPLGISARLESGFASIRGNDAPNSPSSPSVATEGRRPRSSTSMTDSCSVIVFRHSAVKAVPVIHTSSRCCCLRALATQSMFSPGSGCTVPRPRIRTRSTTNIAKKKSKTTPRNTQSSTGMDIYFRNLAHHGVILCINTRHQCSEGSKKTPRHQSNKVNCNVEFWDLASCLCSGQRSIDRSCLPQQLSEVPQMLDAA